MKFDELVQDIETLLASGSPMSKSDGTSSVELEQIPQQVLFEVGRASLEIGQLRQLKTGDVLPVGGCFAPEVTIRVNDRIIGQGELIACGNEFMVRITRWYLSKKYSVNLIRKIICEQYNSVPGRVMRDTVCLYPIRLCN